MQLPLIYALLLISGPALYAFFIWRIWNECIMKTCPSAEELHPRNYLTDTSLYNKFYVELHIAPYPLLILSDNYCLWQPNVILASTCTCVDGGWATLIRDISRKDVANDTCHIKMSLYHQFYSKSTLEAASNRLILYIQPTANFINFPKCR
jgi:hypothetical protein